MFLIFFQSVWAQDKSITLPFVSISATSENRSKSLRPLDSVSHIPGTSLTGLFNQLSGLYLKNYGPGALATIALRGTASTHTALLWNGLPINNAMLGQSDLSLISGPLTLGATLQTGGATQAAVSENFGGILNLGNLTSSKNLVQLGSSVGSFKNIQNWLNINQQIGKTQLRFKLWHLQGQNDFQYHANGETRTQTHAFRRQQGLEISTIHDLSSNLKVELAGWLQSNFRELAPAISEVRSESTQKDKSQRFIARLKWSPKSWKLEVNQGFTKDHLNYENPLAQIYSSSQVQSYFSTMEAKRSVGQWDLGGNIWFGKSIGKTSNYIENKELSRISGLAFGNYSFLKIPIRLWIQVKAERAEYTGKPAQFLPISPSFSAQYKSVLAGDFSVGLHRKYRLPTLNDLYWNPGGNPSLKPEQGWTAEITWNRTFQIRPDFSFQIGLEHFRSWINDYIQWLPQGNYWTPQNLTTVRISGVQLNQKFQYQFGNQILTLALEASITKSIQAKARFEDDEGLGNQLIYIPVYQSIERLQYMLNSFQAEVWIQHCSQRFLNPGNSVSLPSYHTINGRLSYTLSKIKKTDIQLFAESLNLTGKSYQTLSGFAMPLSQFSGGLQINFNN